MVVRILTDEAVRGGEWPERIVATVDECVGLERIISESLNVSWQWWTSEQCVGGFGKNRIG